MKNRLFAFIAALFGIGIGRSEALVATSSPAVLPSSLPEAMALAASPPGSLIPQVLPPLPKPQKPQRKLSLSEVEQIDRAAARRLRRGERLDKQFAADEINRQRLQLRTYRLQ